jgi:N-acetylmuramic acid 6-phosphate etherase
MQVVGVGYDDAAQLLDRAGGRVKTALVMGLRAVDAQEAESRLARANGFVRRARDMAS